MARTTWPRPRTTRRRADRRHRRHGAICNACRGGSSTVYLPLAVFVFVLLFPFYWMAITAVKPNHQLTNYNELQPVLGGRTRRSSTSTTCCSRPPIRAGCWNTMLVSVAATFLSLAASVFAAYAIERRALHRRARRPASLIFLAYLVPPSILFIPLAVIVFKLGIYDSQLGADPHLSDLPHPVLHLAADGLFPLDPLRARGMRAGRRRLALADPDQDHPAAGGARA